MHDLLRLYAQAQAAAVDSAEQRETTLERLLHYYAHTAQTASVPIARMPRPAPEGPAPAYAPDLADPGAARAWLRTEQPNLDAAFTHAHTNHLDEHTIALAEGLAEILYSDGPWARALHILQAIQTAAGHDRPTAYANALNYLGRLRHQVVDLPGAADAQERALEILRQIGSRRNEAWAVNNFAATVAALGDRPRAFILYQQALTMNRELDIPDDEAIALEGIADHHLATGNPTQAVAYLNPALEIFRRLGMRLDIERVQARLSELDAR